MILSMALLVAAWAGPSVDETSLRVADLCRSYRSDRGEALQDEVACRIRMAGPRGLGDPGQGRMREMLLAAMPVGFEGQHVGVGSRSGTLTFCREGISPRVLLILAHVDAVHRDVPGAADNMAGMVLLVDLARDLPPRPERTICLGFPDGEERGLLGSEKLASTIVDRGRTQLKGMLNRDDLDLVVSVDVVGQGVPIWNGLGPAWSAAQARSLLAHAPAQVPWMYRSVSLAYPERERSDHGPFGQRGVLAAHLMSRPSTGITWAYHTPQDTAENLDPEALARTAEVLRQLAEAPPLGPPGPPGTPWFVVPGTTWVLGPWVAWLWSGLALLLAVPALAGRSPCKAVPRELLEAGGRYLLGLLAMGAALGLAGLGRPLGGALAVPVVSALWAAWLLTMLALPRGVGAIGALRSAAALCMLAGLGLWLAGHALLALPVFTAAAGQGLVWLAIRDPDPAPTARSRWLRGGLRAAGTLAAAWAPLYLLSGTRLRELDFHHMVPASASNWLTLAALLTVPLVGPVWAVELRGSVRRWVLVGLGLVLAALLATCWVMDPWQEPFPEREVRWPSP